MNLTSTEIAVKHRPAGYYVARAVKGVYAEALDAQGNWCQRGAQHFETALEAEAFGQGHGVIPLDFFAERVLVEQVQKSNEFVCKLLELKAFPLIDKLILDGRRDDALHLARSIPDTVMCAIAVDRAVNHTPGSK